MSGDAGAPGKTRIVVASDGPLRLEGEVEIVDAEGRPFGLGGRRRVLLCRCGRSGNAPFCDGAHNRASFESAPGAFDLPALPGGAAK